MRKFFRSIARTFSLSLSKTSSLYAKYTEKSIPQHSLHDLYMITTHFVCTFTDNTYIYKKSISLIILSMCLPCPPRFQKSLASIMSEYIMAESYIPMSYTSSLLASCRGQGQCAGRSRPVCWTVKAMTSRRHGDARKRRISDD